MAVVLSDFLFQFEKSVLVLSKFLRLFDNLWTPDDKYSLPVNVSF